MTSLAELRAIEEERIASERAALLAEVEARKRGLAEVEERARAEAEAKLARARDEEIRIAREREQAERAARMHVEAAEATERARLAAALEQERTAQELDLRRQEVAKKRPTWMVAVTIGAVLAAGALTWFGVDRYQQSQDAIDQKLAADAEAKAARQRADQAVAELEAMDAQLADLDGRVGKAIDQILVVDGAVARDAARKNLERLRKEEEELRRRRAERKRLLDEKIRKDGHHMSADCLNNAVC